MGGSADTAGMPDVRSYRAFFSCESVCQDQPLEMKLESIPDFSYSEMCAVRGPFVGTTSGCIISLEGNRIFHGDATSLARTARARLL